MKPTMFGASAPTHQGPAFAHPVERRRRDRRRHTRFMLRERRSGYERRARESQGALSIMDSVHEWHRSTPWLLTTILIAANILSMADILLTMRVLDAGAVELNPLLRALMDFDIRAAGAVKASLVGGATLLIYRYRGYRKIVPLALMSTALFAAVVTYQGLLLLSG